MTGSTKQENKGICAGETSVQPMSNVVSAIQFWPPPRPAHCALLPFGKTCGPLKVTPFSLRLLKSFRVLIRQPESLLILQCTSGAGSLRDGHCQLLWLPLRPASIGTARAVSMAPRYQGTASCRAGVPEKKNSVPHALLVGLISGPNS